jgi:hypothetical protein
MAKTATLGAAIDDIRKLQLKREVHVTKADALDKKIKEKQEKLFVKFKKADLNGAAGKLGRCEVVERDVANVKDFEAVLAYAVKHNAQDLVQKRVNNTAVQARWEQGEKIPGVEKFHYVGLKVLGIKVKRK